MSQVAKEPKRMNPGRSAQPNSPHSSRPVWLQRFCAGALQRGTHEARCPATYQEPRDRVSELYTLRLEGRLTYQLAILDGDCDTDADECTLDVCLSLPSAFDFVHI